MIYFTQQENKKQKTEHIDIKTKLILKWNSELQLNHKLTCYLLQYVQRGQCISPDHLEKDGGEWK